MTFKSDNIVLQTPTNAQPHTYYDGLSDTNTLIDMLALKMNTFKKLQQKMEIADFLNKINFHNTPTQNEHVAAALVDILATKMNSTRKLQQRNEIARYLSALTAADKVPPCSPPKLNINEDNGTEQANRISDLLAIIFNNYRLLVKKNEIISQLRQQINVLS